MIMRNHFVFTLCLLAQSTLLSPAAERPSIAVGTFKQEVRTEFTIENGLPSNDVTSIGVVDGKTVFAGTSKGLARYEQGRWQVVPGTAGTRIDAIAATKNQLLFAASDKLLSLQQDKISPLGALPASMKGNALIAGDPIYLATDQGLFENVGGDLKSVTALNNLLGEDRAVFQIARGSKLTVGAAAGLFQRDEKGKWERLFPCG